MKIPRPTVYCLLAFFAALQLVLRYPRTPHEIGVDSFFVHNLATNIANDGYAEWILNPLSWFGWYPLSYPTGGPVLISDFAQVSGIPIEAGILLLSMGFGTLGILTSYVMAREFRNDDLFCLAVAFVYGFAPRFLAFTLWSASMRSLFMVLLPVFIWIVLRTYRQARVLNFILVGLTFLVLAATHRLAALLAVVLIAFVAAIVLLVILRIIKLQFPRVILASPYRRASPYLALGAFGALSVVMFVGTDVLGEYSTGELFSGPSLDVQILNLGVSLARSVGLSLMFAFAGVVVLVHSRNKTPREPFLLIAFLGLTPTLFLRQYTGFYILPFVALFGALAVVGVFQLRRRRLRQVVIALMFGASLVFSAAVLEYEVQNSTYMPMSMYSTALYVVGPGSRESVVSNDGFMGIRIAAISGCPYIPVGGAGTTFQSPELLAYRFFTAEEVESNTVRLPLQELTLESDSPWITSTIQAEADWVQIMQSTFGDTSREIARFRPAYYLENKAFENQFIAYGNRYASPFAVSVHQGAYKIYDGEAESLWYVGSPTGP